MKYSEYQKEIFREVLLGKSNVAVISRAGVGKTATILESFKYTPKNSTTIAIAFNRHIAKELKEKNKTKADVYTFHSLGLKAIGQKFGDIKVDAEKVTNILFKILERKNYSMIGDFKKAVSIAKVSLQDSPEKIYDFLDYYNIDCLPFTKEEFAKIVIQVLRECKNLKNVVDFDDMIWFPFVYDLPLQKYDNIFIDECQDLNASQLNMSLKLKKENSRIFMFLDDKQAIYSFRCANIKYIMSFIDRIDSKRMSLPMTYRCPKKVVEFVKKYVDDYIAFEENPEGNIIEIDESDLFDNIKDDAVILSRFNAPLMELYFKLIKNKMPANIKGKDIGENLLSFIYKYKSKTIKTTINKIEKQKVSLINSNNLDQLDKIDLALLVLKEVNNFSELRDLIKKVFTEVEDKNKILLSTVHSFKGGERNNVYVLERTLIHSENQEEKNINYVAYTRTKSNLYLVKG